MASSFDGFWVLVVLNSTFQLKQHRGSIVIAGGFSNEKPSDVPVGQERNSCD